jgi:DNA invertase Pin-like site-specific DNA recombinase
VGYVRVSTGKQVESGLGLLAQRAIIEAEVRRRGWQLVAIFEDGGLSGSNLNRPGLDAVLAMLKAKAANALMVAKQDRLSRTVHDLSSLAKLAKQQRWELVAVNLPERTTPANKLMWNMDGAVAEYYRDYISELTKQALAKKRAQGVKLGRRIVVPADVEARIMRLRRRGHSHYRIAQLLTKQGVATAHGAPWWRHNAVQAIVDRVRQGRRAA